MSSEQIAAAVPCDKSTVFAVLKRERERLKLARGVYVVLDSLEPFRGSDASVELLGQRFRRRELQAQGLGYVYARIKAGWSADEALSVPPGKNLPGRSGTVVTRTEFASMMNISRSEVTRWCQTKLAAASSRSGIDVAHPIVREFVRNREGRRKHTA